MIDKTHNFILPSENEFSEVSIDVCDTPNDELMKFEVRWQSKEFRCGSCISMYASGKLGNKIANVTENLIRE